MKVNLERYIALYEFHMLRPFSCHTKWLLLKAFYVRALSFIITTVGQHLIFIYLLSCGCVNMGHVREKEYCFNPLEVDGRGHFFFFYDFTKKKDCILNKIPCRWNDSDLTMKVLSSQYLFGSCTFQWIIMFSEEMAMQKRIDQAHFCAS